MTDHATDSDNLTVTEHDSTSRDPVSGEAVHTIERTIVRRDSSNWGLWVAGIAVAGAALVLVLFLLGRNNDPTAGQVQAAQIEAQAAQARADQAVQDANAARVDASLAVAGAGSQAATRSADASASAAEAAANRAVMAADAASADQPSAPNPAEAKVTDESWPPRP